MPAIPEIEPLIFPDHAQLANIDSWTLLDPSRPLLGVVRAFYWVGTHPRQVQVGEVYGPFETITNEGVGRSITVNKTVRVMSTRTAATEIVRGISLRLQKPAVFNNIRTLVGAAFPTVEAARSVVGSVSAELKGQRTDELTGTVTVESEMTLSDTVTIPEEGSSRVFICPKYRLMERDVYLAHLDFILVDYLTGRKTVLPPPDRADRTFVRAVAASRRTGLANELRCNLRIGSLRFYVEADLRDALRDAPTVEVVDPTRVYFEAMDPIGVGELPRPQGPSLYELARSKRILPNRRDEVFRVLGLADSGQ